MPNTDNPGAPLAAGLGLGLGTALALLTQVPVVGGLVDAAQQVAIQGVEVSYPYEDGRYDAGDLARQRHRLTVLTGAGIVAYATTRLAGFLDEEGPGS